MKKHLLRLAMILLTVSCVLVFPVKAQAAGKRGLIKTALVMKPYQKTKIRVRGYTNNEVKWESLNKNIATVKNGTILALDGGKTVVTAIRKGKTWRCKVTVVSINYTSVIIAKKQVFKLKVKNGLRTKWKSKKSSVVKVNRKGQIRGKKTGKATIVCKSNGKTFKTKVYVASLNTGKVHLAMDDSYQLTVQGSPEKVSYSSDFPDIVEVNSTGLLVAHHPGKATITCKTGKAVMHCKVTVIQPNNLTTSITMLPTASKVDRQEVTITGYPTSRTYTIYNQAASVNKTDGKGLVKTNYMPGHGCAACSLATVLSGFKNYKEGPVGVVETIEPKVFGESVWKANYSMDYNKQMPVSLYGISKVLNYYGIPNRYVRYFPGSLNANNEVGDGKSSDQKALAEIKSHLLTGNPVVFVVSTINRDTGAKDTRWSNSYHTMVMLGLTSSGKVIIADSANRSKTIFGTQQRVKYAELKDIIPFMFSSTNINSVKPYWVGKSKSAGYVLVNPQN